MSDTTRPSLEDIRSNLLEVRDNVHFNIGSPQAIDHLLISIVAVIDAIMALPPPPNPHSEKVE